MESASKITYIRYFYENLNNSSLFISKKLFMFAGHIAHSNPYCEGAISRFQAALSRHIAIQGSRSRRYCLRSANSKSHSRRVTNFETLTPTEIESCGAAFSTSESAILIHKNQNKYIFNKIY